MQPLWSVSVAVVSVIGVESPLALYRRYRPETFAEVIGQDHVTDPLRAALANNRVNHAYLFSGPRGCGKTTSARILARTLNCELAPVPDPCGQCQSCRDLARNGPGSLDVIEIDAASHGGVDDARDLREKAFFAPVSSRYKVYVVDEAHMVTPAGFNALLKLVEEPPPHLRFIFATTAPEKVLATIRSRTHHYPFRLIPPRLLSTYLTELCAREDVRIDPAAIPLVVRAGGGSARDTLSILDQLIGGAGASGVTHELATGLLGYTPDTLLDEVVDAFAAGDGGAVFGVVDKVIETGQDPRRFTEDLLRRLRDLVIVAAVPDASATGLIDVSPEQGERLVSQAARYGTAELSRAADIVATGLTEMRGATAPRLLLELVCARVLLPGADHSTVGVMARLDRIERRAAITGTPSAALPAPNVPSASLAAPLARVVVDPPLRLPAQDRPAADRPVARESVEPPGSAVPPPAHVAAAAQAPVPAPVEPPPPSSPASPASEPVVAPVSSDPPAWGAAAVPGASSAAPRASTPEPEAAHEATLEVGRSSAAPAGPVLSLVDVRRLWPDVIEATKHRRRVTWIHLSQNSQVVAVGEGTLTLGFSNSGARESFDSNGSAEIVRQSVIDVIGADWRVETINDPGADAGLGAPPSPEVAPEPPAPASGPADPVPTTSAGPAAGPAADRASAPPWARGEADVDPAPPVAERVVERAPATAAPGPSAPAAAPTDDRPAPPEPPEDPDGAPPDEPPEPVTRDDPPWARPGAAVAAPRTPADLRAADADARPDDQDAEHDALGGADLLARELGAKMIEEIRHQ